MPKRKKAHTEVEILEARLETIESAYSERLSQMESLLNRVMPGVQIQEQLRNGKEIASGQALDIPGPSPSNTQRQGTASTNESEWADIDSPLDGTQPLVPDWEQGAPGTSSGVRTLMLIMFRSMVLTTLRRGLTATSTLLEHGAFTRTSFHVRVSRGLELANIQSHFKRGDS